MRTNRKLGLSHKNQRSDIQAEMLKFTQRRDVTWDRILLGPESGPLASSFTRATDYAPSFVGSADFGRGI